MPNYCHEVCAFVPDLREAPELLFWQKTLLVPERPWLDSRRGYRFPFGAAMLSVMLEHVRFVTILVESGTWSLGGFLTSMRTSHRGWWNQW